MELSAGYIITASFRTYFKHFLAIIRYPLIIATMWSLVGAVSIFFLGNDFLNGNHTSEPSWGAMATVLLVAIMAAIASIPLTLGLTRTLYRLYTGAPITTISDEIHTVKPLIWPSIFTSILAGILVLGGTILLIIPGIWLGICYSLVHTAVAIDGHKGMDALRVSKDLVSGRWWRVFWWNLAPGIIIWIVSTLLQFLLLTPTGFFAGVSLEGGYLLSTIMGPVVSLLVFPLAALPAVITYTELKKAGPATASKA